MPLAMAAPNNKNSKQAILQSTAGLMQRKAFAEISLADIAREAGISKGTLYYYYNNKDDIIFDITDSYLKKLADDFLVWVDDESKDTNIQRLVKYVLQRGSVKELGSLRLYLISAAVSGQETLRTRYLERYLFFKETIQQKIEQRLPQIDGEYLSWFILTTMDGILIQDQLQNEQFHKEEFINRTVLQLGRVLSLFHF